MNRRGPGDALAAKGDTSRQVRPGPTKRPFGAGPESGSRIGASWVEVTGGKVAATAFEIGSNPGEFTTLTVTPVQ